MRILLIITALLATVSCSKQEKVATCSDLKQPILKEFSSSISSGNELYVLISKNKWIKNQELELNSVMETLNQLESASLQLKNSSDAELNKECNVNDMYALVEKINNISKFITSKSEAIKDNSKALESKISSNKCEDINSCIIETNSNLQNQLSKIKD